MEEPDFAALAERHRRELQVHCYRMLGSLEEAEDMVQETLLRAWRGRRAFEGRSSARAWLYRIATNACLDALRRRPRRVLVADVPAADPAAADPPEAELPWLQPYPDRLLDAVPDRDAGPAEAAEARETIELAFLAAIQHLPPRQRAALILRDALGWSARETARAARDQRRGGQQRPAARPRGAGGAPARAPVGVGAAAGAPATTSGRCWPATSTPWSGPTSRA